MFISPDFYDTSINTVRKENKGANLRLEFVAAVSQRCGTAPSTDISTDTLPWHAPGTEMVKDKFLGHAPRLDIQNRLALITGSGLTGSITKNK